MSTSANPAPANSTPQAERHPIGFHEGEALWKFAKTYDLLPLTLLEAAQNAVDANATCIYIGVDLRERTAVICDDGDGVTTEKYQEALLSVAFGVKSKEKLGKFGLGMISPLNKCRCFRFMSRPDGQQHVNSWTFVGEVIRQQRKTEVVYQPLDSFPALPALFRDYDPTARGGKRGWQTVIMLDELIDDSVKTEVDVDELAGFISERLGIAMRRQKATVFIKVRDKRGRINTAHVDPLKFTGEPLDTVMYDGGHSGKVTIKLYRAPLQDGERKGKVVVMEAGDDYPLDVKVLQPQAMGARISGMVASVHSALKVLGSGHFEGTIEAEHIKLVEKRDKFELNDALRELFLLLGDWYDKIGKNYIDADMEEKREERYQQLSQQALNELLRSLHNDRHMAKLARQLQALLPRLKEKAVKERGERKNTERKPQVRSEPKRLPIQAQNPDGSKNAGAASFLRFNRDVMPGSPYLWVFDPETYTLTFNIRHPLWVLVDETDGARTKRHDEQIVELQKFVGLQVILMLLRREELPLDVQRVVVDEQIGPFISLFILPPTAK